MPRAYSLEREIERAAHLLTEADSLIVLAGAGMSVDSGLPDYRGTSGWWTNHAAFKAAGVTYEQASSGRMFFHDPQLAWGVHGHKLAVYRNARPHAGYAVLRRWVEQLPHESFVFTSNIDGQFQAAGFSEKAIQECHGSVHWLQCSKRCTETIWSARNLIPSVSPETLRWEGDLPRCIYCDSVARPNVLMFEDAHWVSGKDEQQAKQFERWRARVARPVALEIGAGTGVLRVRRLSDLFSRRFIRVNPYEASVRDHEVGVQAGALEALRAMAAWLR
jgi:NAD-dependent SIR2 family protein deacetylase